MSDEGFSVSEAADRIGYHPQTIRTKIKEGMLEAWKVEGSYGPEWRIDPDDVESLAAEAKANNVDSESKLSASNTRLSAIDSSLAELRDMIQRIANGQKRLQPAPQEVEARQEQQERIEEALTGNVKRIQELVRENAELEQELARSRQNAEELQDQADTLAKQNERLTQALQQERERSWWDKLTGRGSDG